MEFCLRTSNGRLGPSVVVTGDAFAEVVGLHCAGRLAKVVATELPINFIEVIRDHDDAGDYAGSWGGLGYNVDLAE